MRTEVSQDDKSKTRWDRVRMRVGYGYEGIRIDSGGKEEQIEGEHGGPAFFYIVEFGITYVVQVSVIHWAKKSSTWRTIRMG